MGRDNAPVGYTCRTIDDIISLLENVRSDNADLRDWGNKLYEENESLKERIEDLEAGLQ